MKSRNSNLLNVTPLGVYLISFLSENYLFGRSVSFELILKNSVLDDAILILGNLLIILLFIKKGYTNINKSCCRTAMASFDKGLFLWILILELSAILPINLFVAILDFGDYATATLDCRYMLAGAVCRRTGYAWWCRGVSSPLEAQRSSRNSVVIVAF